MASRTVAGISMSDLDWILDLMIKINDVLEARGVSGASKHLIASIEIVSLLNREQRHVGPYSNSFRKIHLQNAELDAGSSVIHGLKPRLSIVSSNSPSVS
jgi:hypothetical protein